MAVRRWSLAARVAVASVVSAAAAACTRPLPSPALNAGATPQPLLAAVERAAITAAAEAYVRSQSGLTAFLLEAPVVAGDYARVRAVPESPGAPGLWVYLVRQGTHWQGLVLGERFAAATYDLYGIPQALRLPPAPLGGPASG